MLPFSLTSNPRRVKIFFGQFSNDGNPQMFICIQSFTPQQVYSPPQPMFGFWNSVKHFKQSARCSNLCSYEFDIPCSQISGRLVGRQDKKKI